MNVAFSSVYGCWVWECIAGHRAIDFESKQEALDDFARHACPYN